MVLGFLWGAEESDHDKAVKIAKRYLQNKYKLKAEVDKSTGRSRKRIDLCAWDEETKRGYVCEVKDSIGDLERALDQLETALHELKGRRRKANITAYLGVTKGLYQEITKRGINYFEDFKRLWRKRGIKILTISKTKVEELR